MSIYFIYGFFFVILRTNLEIYIKAVILAGGFGTRISEESHLRSRPMIEIGGKPILWHVMKWYNKFGKNTCYGQM